MPDWLVSALAAGGGGAVIALGVVRAFGTKWLDSKFASRLQDLRHEHEKRMEVAKLDSSRALDRFTRLSEREFETSATAWSHVWDAYVKTMSALPGFRQHDDFSRLSDELARVVAGKNGFEEFEIEALLGRRQEDRNSYFNERKRLHELRDAKFAVREATNYLDRNALFLEQDVYEKSLEFANKAWRAIVAREIIMEIGARDAEGITRDDEEFRANAENDVKELERLVRGRFWNLDEEAKS